MQRHVDVLFLGGGTVAEVAAPLVRRAGLSVAVVEAMRIGGECAYVACVPGKAMLHRADRLARDATAGERRRAWAEAIDHRDAVAGYRSDHEAAETMRDADIDIVRGHGVITRGGTVEVGGDAFVVHHLVICTGSTPVVPPIAGLNSIQAWTSADALSTAEFPARPIILGGSAVGCELAQMYARFGAMVTVIEQGPHLLPQEDPVVGATLAKVLVSDGVRIFCGRTATAVEATPTGVTVACEGEYVYGDRVILAAGREPATRGIGVEHVGGTPGKPLAIDDSCRVSGHGDVWAGGDVVATAPFTHTAAVHGRVIAQNIIGRDPATMAGRVMPRCVYTRPEVAACGLTAAGAEERHEAIDTVTVGIGETERAATDEETHGVLVLHAGRWSGVIVGAAVVAPAAGELIGELVTAVQMGLPVERLAEITHPFPTYGQLIEAGMRRLVGMRIVNARGSAYDVHGAGGNHRNRDQRGQRLDEHQHLRPR